jgi:hypothetical protein
MLCGSGRAVIGVIAMAIAIMAGTAGAATAPATSRPRPAATPVLRPAFSRVGHAGWVWAGSRYTLVGPAESATDEAVTLIDDDTGHHTVISRPGCSPVQPSVAEPLSLPRLPFSCGPVGRPVPELYSPSTGQWQTVAPATTISHPCQGDPLCFITDGLTAAGTAWLEYIQSNCPMDEHCGYKNIFENINTGAVRQNPSSSQTTLSLNAEQLTEPVCQPLRVPTARQLFAGPGPGSLTFYGRFAVALGTDQNANPTAYLERCGTHLHRLLVKGPYPGALLAPAANTHEAVWMPRQTGQLSAVTLPGLHPFRVRLPSRILDGGCSASQDTTCVAQIALTQHRLFVLITPSGQLWSAPATVPRARTTERR